MATTATLVNVGHIFPAGTTVTAAVDKTGSGPVVHGRRGGGSVASPITATATTATGAAPHVDVAFTGLTAATRYVAVGGSPVRYVSFWVD